VPDLTPIAGEILVNSTTAGDQTPASLSVLSGGGSVAAFLDAGAGGLVAKLRLFAADESPASGEITLGAATGVQTAALEGGGFAATWIETTATQSFVHAEVFDASGQALGAVQTLASYNEVLDLANGINHIGHPLGLHMTALTDGGYAATWTVQGADSFFIRSLGYQLVVADSHGAVETNTLHGTVGGSKSIALYDPDATPVQLADGNLMVTWFQQGVSAPATGDGFDSQHVQLFDLTGAAIGGDLHLDALMPPDGGAPASGAAGLTAAALDDGHVVFAWNQNGNVEVSIYPEDTLGAGFLNGRTVPQVVGPITGAGAPQVVALGGGGFAVVWSGTGDGADVMARVYAANGTPQGDAFHLGDITSGAQDLPLIAAHGDGLIAIWRDASHLAGDASGTAVMLQTFEPTGGETPNVLIGTSAPDALAGGAGEDWLMGLGGADTLSGGLGADKFIFTEGGGTDRVLDFTHGQDHILVFDAQGNISDASHGALIFDAATHTLSFDPDGGAGPAAVDPLAVLDGVSSIGRSDLAAGLQPRAINEIHADGSVEKTVFDWGSAAFDNTVTEINPAGAMKSYAVNQDDGSHWTTWFDAKSAQDWASRTASYDAQGALTDYSVTYDDGHREVFAFDPHNAQPWQRTVDDYDAAGQLTTRAMVYDDGTAKVATFDVGNTHPWSMLVDIFDPTGRQTAHWTYNDDGTFIG
jgi:hypothetical protein